MHGANGYLIDQFLRDGTNKRADRYGGSVENRTRFLVEVLEAVTAVFGGDRVGLRLSPLSPASDMSDSNPEAIFNYAVEQTNRFGLAYLHVIEGATGGPRQVPGGFDLQILRRRFRGLYMANNGYDLAMAVRARREGVADLIAFGKPFISNPDLVERLRDGLPLASPDPATFYGGGETGYTDYPAAAQRKAA